MTPKKPIRREQNIIIGQTRNFITFGCGSQNVGRGIDVLHSPAPSIPAPFDLPNDSYTPDSRNKAANRTAHNIKSRLERNKQIIWLVSFIFLKHMKAERPLYTSNDIGPKINQCLPQQIIFISIMTNQISKHFYDNTIKPLPIK